jgi:hypothetical protein
MNYTIYSVSTSSLAYYPDDKIDAEQIGCLFSSCLAVINDNMLMSFAYRLVILACDLANVFCSFNYRLLWHLHAKN